MSRSPAPLTDKQRRFVEEYTGPCRLNATRAAKAAGYSEKTASLIGSENLRKPYIRDAIAKRLEQHSMSAAEATERLAEMARGNISTKVVRRVMASGEVVETEEYDMKDALKEILRIHGAYAQPDVEGVKFLVVRDLSEWEATG